MEHLPYLIAVIEIEIRYFTVIKISAQDQEITEFFQRALSHVVEAGFVCPPPSFEAFGDVGRDRYRCSPHLRNEPKPFVIGQLLGKSVDIKHESVCLLPNVQLFE